MKSEKKVLCNQECDNFPIKIILNNYVENCGTGNIERFQAVYAIFKELCNELRHSKNSPREMVEDIRFLIDDYVEFNIKEEIRKNN